MKKGGGDVGIARHTQKNRKLLVRDRLRLLLDDDDDFLELSSFAGLDLPYGDIPAASCLTGQNALAVSLLLLTVYSVIVVTSNSCVCIPHPHPLCSFASRRRQDQWLVVRVHRQRRHGERRHSVSNHGQEAASSARNSHSEPPALYLPGGLWWRLPTAAGLLTRVIRN